MNIQLYFVCLIVILYLSLPYFFHCIDFIGGSGPLSWPCSETFVSKYYAVSVLPPLPLVALAPHRVQCCVCVCVCVCLWVWKRERERASAWFKIQYARYVLYLQYVISRQRRRTSEERFILKETKLFMCKRMIKINNKERSTVINLSTYRFFDDLAKRKPGRTH